MSLFFLDGIGKFNDLCIRVTNDNLLVCRLVFLHLGWLFPHWENMRGIRHSLIHNPPFGYLLLRYIPDGIVLNFFLRLEDQVIVMIAINSKSTANSIIAIFADNAATELCSLLKCPFIAVFGLIILSLAGIFNHSHRIELLIKLFLI